MNKNIPSQTNGMLSTEERQQSEGIPDQLIAALQNLEQETLLMSELSDVDEILKDLLELDDDFLDSLTTQICADVDMSKYTDCVVDTSSNNCAINLLNNSNVAVVEPQVSLSAIVPHVELSEPPLQVKASPAMQIVLMENVTENHISYFETSHQVSTMKVRQKDESKGEELAQNHDYKKGICQQAHNRLTYEELAVEEWGEGVKSKISKRSQIHKRRTVKSQIPVRMHRPKKLMDKSFRKKHESLVHIEGNEDKKLYQCELCNKVCKRKYSLLTHSRIHTGERPYQCEVCNKAFSHKNHLLSHSRIHTGERPYQCEVCNKAFSQKNHLLSHSRIHTGEMPYQCEACEKSFRWKVSLLSHSRQHWS